LNQPADHLIQTNCDLKGQQKLFWLYLDKAASCCRADHVDLSHFGSLSHLEAHWKQEHQQLQQGVQVPSCNTCWQHERQGLKSWRQLQPPTNHVIELYLNNACNQMCSYCSPKFSSTWQKSITDLGMLHSISATAQRNLQIPVISQNDAWVGQIESYIKEQAADSLTIKLLGGEPLMQHQSLKQLIKLCHNQVRQLRINTNLNPPSAKFLHWILETVPPAKLGFDISIDATPSYNHVPRGLFDVSKFLANLELIKSHRVEYRFLAVVSALSVFDLPNFVTWCQQNQHAYSLFPINNPACLDPKLIPAEFKNQIDQINLPDHIRQLLNYDQPQVDLKLFEQYNYLQQYFERTQQDPHTIDNKVFVQYWSWLEKKFYENSNRIRPAS
jgi:sulfatase maturation enzyme AslB (radical SAM superfamily)